MWLKTASSIVLDRELNKDSPPGRVNSSQPPTSQPPITTQRQRETETETENDRDRERMTERNRDRKRETETETERQTDRERETDRKREKETQRKTGRKTQRERETETERESGVIDVCDTSPVQVMEHRPGGGCRGNAPDPLPQNGYGRRSCDEL